MQSQPLIQALTQITSDFRRGDEDVAYQGYRDLFTSPTFTSASADDRRAALLQLVHAQGAPAQPTRIMRVALEAALAPLRELIAERDDPRDRDLLRDLKARLA